MIEAVLFIIAGTGQAPAITTVDFAAMWLCEREAAKVETITGREAACLRVVPFNE